MRHNFSNADLQGYLDEALSTEMMIAIEEALRDQEELAGRLSNVIGRRDAGVHSLGEIWRRHRLSCPHREELGSYLLGVVDKNLSNYVQFHLETVGCRYCTANLEDLRARQEQGDVQEAEGRHQKYFHSSAGYLVKKR